jgi:hypothetical protein
VRHVHRKVTPTHGGAIGGGGSGKGVGSGGGARKPAAHHKPVRKKVVRKVKRPKKVKKPVKRHLAGPVLAGGWVTGWNDRLDSCVPAAIANSLLLATGVRASDGEVLALWERAGSAIPAVLEAVARYGVAGVRPADFHLAPLDEIDWSDFIKPGLILGVDLPGPHAVLAVGGVWITWGQRYPAWAFPDAVVEEAWIIEWPAARLYQEDPPCAILAAGLPAGR